MKDYSTILEWTDEQILEEVHDIKYLYGLKDVIRYGIDRKENPMTQSVAEHSALMILLAKYFLKLEKNVDDLDVIKIYEMILVHDMGEIETGDFPTFTRTKEIDQEEREMFSVVNKKSPDLLGDEIQKYLQEYEDQETREAQFVKSIDKLEPSFYMYGEKGKKMLIEGTKFTEKQFEYCKEKETTEIIRYPVMFKFFECLSKHFKTHQYFIPHE